MSKWKVKLIFRGYYRLPGTGIVEKNHRTINFPITVSVFGRIIDLGCNSLVT